MSNELPEDDAMLARLFALAEGSLTSEDAVLLQTRLVDEPDLAAAFAELQAIRSAIEPTPISGFAPGFAERVHARLIADRTLTPSLQRQFRRLWPIAAAAILVLGVRNVMTGRAQGATAWEAALGLTPVSMDMALTTDTGLRTNGEATP